jgi:F-type H+-transporting ATPase subunit epsilon
MPRRFPLSIYAADHQAYEGETTSVIIPMAAGYRGIMAGHQNTVFAIVPGRISIQVPGEAEKRVFVVSNGILKMEEGKCLILVNTCERPEDLDINRIKKAEERARRQLREQRDSREYQLAVAKLNRALNRLRQIQHENTKPK